MSKRRKVDDEKRVFKDNWTELYFFIQHHEKPVCLICNETIAVNKEYNLKRHHETKHKAVSEFKGLERKEKLEKLKSSMEKQQRTFVQRSAENVNNTKASYAVSSLIAKKMKPFTDGEFVKDCLMEVVQIVCPEKKSLFENISTSSRTVTRTIEDMATSAKDILRKSVESFDYFSMALDESTDILDTAQLAIFIRGIDSNFEVTEELVKLEPLMGKTTSEDILNGFRRVVKEMYLDLHKLISVTTDGAPAMVGSKKGFVTLLDKQLKSDGFDQELLKFHCIVHQEALCAKSAGLTDESCHETSQFHFVS